MGNTVTVKISLDHEAHEKDCAIVAGSELTGTVFAKADRAMKTKHGITVNVIGNEKVEIRHGKPNGKKKIIVAGRPVFTAQIEVTNKTLKAGKQYKFPFSIHLPESLPSSVHGRDNAVQKSLYRLHYKVFVNLGDSHSGLGKTYFTVASKPLPDTRILSLVHPMFHTIKSDVDGSTQGSVMLGAKLEDAHVGRGKDLELFLACRNDAIVDIECVQVRVLEHAKFTAKDYAKKTTRILTELANVQLPALEIKVSPQSEHETSKNNRRQQMMEMYNDIQEGQNKLLVHVPYDAKDSYNGSLIKIKHELSITLVTKSDVSNPYVKIPIKIGFPPQEEGEGQEELQEQQDIRRSGRGLMSKQKSVPCFQSKEFEDEVSENGDNDDNNNNDDDDDDDDEEENEETLTLSRGASIVGGIASYIEDEEEEAEEKRLKLPPTIPESLSEKSSSVADEVSMNVLMQELAFSLDDYEILETKLNHPEWKPILTENLTPEDLGTIMTHIDVTVDQPRAAELLAANSSNFTCAHVVSALQNGGSEVRPAIIQATVPYCSDLENELALIEAELNEWEQVVAQEHIQKALVNNK